VGLLSYFYPFADEDVAGTKVPLFLDASVFASYSTLVDVKMTVWYYYGVQEAISGERYVYLNPSVGKSFPLTGTLGLDLALAFGYKVYTVDREAEDGSENTDNVVDVVAGVGLPWAAADGLTVTPSVNVGWSNYKAWSLGDEIMPWAAVLASYEI